MNRNVLIVDQVVKRYPGFLLDNVSFELQEGTITGFIGKNGAGKSTTLKMIMKLIKSDSGNIDIQLEKSDGAYPIGYLGMDKEIYPDEKLKEIAKFVGKAWKKNWSEEEFHYYAETVFGLDINKKMKELSTGMIVKFLLSIELAKNPQLLLLDEPTSGLDPIVREEILSILKELVDKKKITVLFSSHITEDIVKIADNVIFINRGKVVLQGSKQSVLKRYVKMRMQDLNRLPEDALPKITECGVPNREFIIWDNEIHQIDNQLVEDVTLDEVLIALGGKKND